MKKIGLRDFEERKRYDRILQQLKYKAQTPLKEETPVMTKSRVWKKFYMKVLTDVILPAGIFFALISLAFGAALALTYFGMHPGLALVVGPAVVILGPLFFTIMRGLYKEAMDEVTNENKSLMQDLKGDPR